MCVRRERCGTRSLDDRGLPAVLFMSVEVQKKGWEGEGGVEKKGRTSEEKESKQKRVRER